MSKLSFTGSIELTAIPKEVIKVVEKKDENGNVVSKKMYLNFAVFEMDKASEYGDTHCISCAPKKEERNESTNYLCGHLKPWVEKEKQEDPAIIAAAPAPSASEKLPWDD